MRRIVNGYVINADDELLKTSMKKIKIKKRVIEVVIGIIVILSIAVSVFASYGDKILPNLNKSIIDDINKFGIIPYILFLIFFAFLPFITSNDFRVNSNSLEMAKDIKDGNILNFQLTLDNINKGLFDEDETGIISYEKTVNNKRIRKKYNVIVDYTDEEEIIDINRNGIYFFIKSTENNMSPYEKICKEYNIKQSVNEKSDEYKSGFVAGMCQLIQEMDIDEDEYDVVNKILEEKF